MTGFDFLDFISICILTLAAVLSGTMVFRHFWAGTQTPGTSFDPHGLEPAIFLFDDHQLVDQTPRGARLLSRAKPGDSPWVRFIEAMEPFFPDLPERLEALSKDQSLDLWSHKDGPYPVRLMVEWRNELLRISVIEPNESGERQELDSESLFAMERESKLLSAIGAHAPVLIWKTDGRTGQINWANSAYLDVARRVEQSDEIPWPPPNIFSKLDLVAEDDNVGRKSLSLPDGAAARWFDLQTFPFNHESLNFAVPADAAVQAEGALREFIQTLAKTFAHLPIGLAIFSQERRLVLFNPALTDLTALPVDFLSSRPSLATFLDELRNRRLMPEPKDYKGWRKAITELETKSVKGVFTETWSLPNGLTYRVSGRPHPEGAMALLFEDITSEVTLTRRFRRDMELGQLILDNVEDGVCTFSQDGTLTASNTVFADQWGVDPQTTLGKVSLMDCIAIWNDACEPDDIWARVRDSLGLIDTRSIWSDQIRLKTGKSFKCRVVPLSGGGLMITFRDLGSDSSKQIQSESERALGLP